jgi:hypothetical protein
MTSLMNTGRQGAKSFILLLLAALGGIGYGVTADAIPLDVSGSIGYDFRSLNDPQGMQTIDNQLLGTLNLSSYIWRPWLATTEMALTATFDSTDYDNSASNTNTKILTGELHLNVLPQSRTPFQLMFDESDSRVDNFSVDQPLVIYKDQYKTRRLELLQSYITDGGNRFAASYDRNTYDSRNTGNFLSNKFGLEGDVRLPHNHFVGNGNWEFLKQTSDAQPQTVDTNKAYKTFFNLNHFWYPSSAVRVDSMVSYNNSRNNVDLPDLSSNQLQDSTTDLAQLSSFIFYRPEQRPLTLSGGVRFYDLATSSSIPAYSSQLTDAQNISSGAGQNLSNDLKTMSMSATGGGIYQYTKNLRFDANVDVSTTRTNDRSTNYPNPSNTGYIVSTQERAGALYQSDIIDLMRFNYQWFTDLSGSNEVSQGDSVQRGVWSLSHNGQRAWTTSPDSMLSVSLSQSFSEDYTSVVQDGTDKFAHQLTDSGYLTWNQSAWNGTTTLRLTLSDIRDLANMDNQQQLANFQATRTQEISRRANLTGDLTVQNVHQSYVGQAGASSVTTATGRLNFTYRELFGVNQLDFLSDLYVSRASRDATLDRGEWENRLTYNVGQLYTSASYRLIRIDSDTFDLIYFQISRHF